MTISVLCLSLCLAFLHVADSQLVAVQPWKAAEAAMTTLSDSTLKAVDSKSIEVFCGQKVNLGLEVHDRLYEVIVGNEADFRRVETPKLPDKMTEVSEGSLSELTMDVCILPDVTLAGPLEIEWTEPSRAQLLTPPEAYVISNVTRVIVEDGAHIKLSDLTDLQLQNPLPLRGLTESYLNEVYGRKRSDQQTFSHTFGLMDISTSVQEEARKQGVPLKLQATSSNMGFSIRQLPHHPIRAVETAQGTLRISSAKSDGMNDGHVEHPWLWPLPDATLSDVVPYEALFKQILVSHWPKIKPRETSLTLRSAMLQAATLLHLQMEVRTNRGQTQILDAHVLVDNAGHYIPVNSQAVNSDQYTTVLSQAAALNLLNVNSTIDPDLRLYDVYI